MGHAVTPPSDFLCGLCVLCGPVVLCGTTGCLRTAAIFAPHASRKHLGRFQAPDVEITKVETLADAAAPDVALAFGGDGTIHRQLDELARTRIPLLVVPVGSGNDFAAAIGMKTVDDAVAGWERFRAKADNLREVDLGVIRPLPAGESVFYCCVAGAGLDSETNRRANSLPAWLRSRGGYALSAAASIFLYRPKQVTVRVADSAAALDPAIPRTKKTTLVAFANAPAYGGGMRIAPRAQLDDGKLDVCFVSEVAPLRLLGFFPRVFSGSHLSMEQVEYWQTAALRVESEKPMDVYADGEPVARTPVEVTVAPRALRVIVPATVTNA